MATAAIPSPPQRQTEPVRDQGVISEGGGEWRVVFRGVDWETYSNLVDSCREGSPIKLAFDGRDLEIMTTGNQHEIFKTRIGRMVDALTEELEIAVRSVDQTTWKRPAVDRGLEADHTYYFTEDKQLAADDAPARGSNRVDDYPNPDLAIEIDLSRSKVDRPAIYAALKVPEVWRFDGRTMVIERLTAEGAYSMVERSGFMPIDAVEITRWLLEGLSSQEIPWIRRFRAWVREDLVRRVEAPQ
jgi:Uma2 family endonuclease